MKQEIKDLDSLVRVLVKHNVEYLEFEGIKIRMQPTMVQPPPIKDDDDRREDGHRLKPPTDKEIKQERLEQW